MVTNFIAQWGLKRRFAWLALMLGVSILLVRGSMAQEEPIRPERARQALNLAIDHYKRGDFETAQGYFLYAHAGQQHLSLAEQKELNTFGAKNTTALNTKRDGAVQIQLAEQAIKNGQMNDAANLMKALNINEYLTPDEKQQVAALNRKVQGAVAGGKSDAKSLLAAGRAALQAGDLASAESLAVQAEKAGSGLTTLMQPWSDSPAKLRKDILASRTKQEVAPPPGLLPQETAKSASKFMNPIWPFGSIGAAKKDEEQVIHEKMARHILQDGYRALDVNNLDMARQFALKAKELPVRWTANEPTPDALLHEIQRRSPNPGTLDPATAGQPGKDADPRNLMRLGRSLLAQKNFEEADKVCNQASAIKDARWGLFEDTPDKLRKEIQRVRAVHERDESFKVMAEARKMFNQGNLDEAEKNAYLAKKMHGPYGVFDFGDRPDKLIEEITRARHARGDRPPPVDVAKKDGNRPNGPPVAPPGVIDPNKSRAIAMVREARDFERQGMFLEAKQRAAEARSLKARFTPEEDSPDAVLASILFRCDQQIQAYLQQATEQVRVANDPQRFEKAHGCIVQARRVAQTFDLDTNRIEQTAFSLKQVASGTLPFNNTGGFQPGPVPLTGDPQRDAWLKAGREKLQHAQLELANKNCATARKICEDLYDPRYGVQQDVARLVRSIMAEEYNQALEESKRTFDAAVEAYSQRKFQRALWLFQAINPALLPEHYQQRMRDFMAMPDMQPTKMIEQVSSQTGREHLKATPIPDKGGTPTRDPERENALEDWKNLQAVQIQQLRHQGVDVLRRSNELFNHKEKEQKQKAIDTLDHYIKQVELAKLEPAKANELRRLPEARIQQYKSLLDQDRLAGVERSMRTPMFYDEPKRARDDAKLKEQLYEKMKLAHDLMKQNKLKEAEVVVDQVRSLDSENVAALAAKRIIQTRNAQEEWDRNVHSQERFFKDQLAHTRNPNLTPENPIEFPDKDYIKRRRDGGGAIPYQLRDPKEKAIEYRLRQPISLHLKDRPLQDALRDISALSGIQVVPDLAALQEARVSLDAPLSIAVEDIDMKFALNILLKPLKLSYTIDNQVLMITSDHHTKGRAVRVTYPIADLVIAVENHPLPDVLNTVKALERSMQPPQLYPGYQGAGPFFNNPGAPVSSHGGQYASDPSAPGGYSLTQPPGGTGKRGPDEMAKILMELIKGAVAKNSWEDMGGQGNIQFFPLGMALVINQEQEVQEQVQQLLASLRRLQDLQVSVELRAVLVSETFFERIGVDFDMNLRTPTSRREPDLINGTFVPAPFVNRTADRLGGLISGLTSAGTLTPDLNVPIRNSSFNFTTPQFGGYQPEAGIQLGLAFLSDIQVFMFLEAVQGDRRAHIMQAPKITVYNGQQATIGGLMTRPQVTGVIPTVLGNNQVVMMPNLSQIPFGLAMTVQPTVSPDRRYIRLNVTPIQAGAQQDPAAAQVLVFPGTVQGTLDGGGTSPAFVNNPLNVTIAPTTVQLTIANTTVNVPDGGTVLLGGFRFLAEERTEYGPPILSKIPYLSRLFRNVGWSRDGSTLVYLVTARVIMVEEEERLFMGEIAPIPGR